MVYEINEQTDRIFVGNYCPMETHSSKEEKILKKGETERFSDGVKWVIAPPTFSNPE